MNIRARPSTHQPIVAGRQHAAGKYQKVFDQRKRRIRGLWIRNDRYYAQLTVPGENSGKKVVRRVCLEDPDSGEPVTTVAKATAVLNRLKVDREDHRLTTVRKRTPEFAEYAEEYFRFYETVRDAKRPATLRTERVCIRRWREFLGETRLSQINKPMINGFIAQRQAAGVSGRTVNLEVIALRNVLKRAIDDGYLKTLPMENLKPLKWKAEKKRLVTVNDIEKVCQTAIEIGQNGVEFADFIRLMAFSGARWSEALRLRWSDVNFDLRQLSIGTDGLSKNRLSREVDFNVRLETHLKEMANRRAPDSEYLFPSPRRGESDVPAITFNMTLRKVREKAGLPWFTCHLCRHFFISFCVMSGIDYMTIGRWVGHQDGGVLIGKVYGHLSNEHTQRKAQKLTFTSENPISPSGKS